MFAFIFAISTVAPILAMPLSAERPMDVFGTTMTVEVPQKSTRGLSSTLRVEVPPGGGPPAAHVHTREDEMIVVTRGHFRFWHGAKVTDLYPGQVLYLPRNEPHMFRNVGTTQGEELLTITPGRFENFFREIGNRKFVMPRDYPAVVRLTATYGTTYVPSLEKK